MEQQQPESSAGVRTSPSVRGWLNSSASRLHLRNESDHQTYDLSGDLASLKASNRVRLKGKKSRDAAKSRTFLVEKVSKDLSPCKVVPATP